MIEVEAWKLELWWEISRRPKWPLCETCEHHYTTYYVDGQLVKVFCWKWRLWLRPHYACPFYRHILEEAEEEEWEEDWEEEWEEEW